MRSRVHCAAMATAHAQPAGLESENRGTPGIQKDRISRRFDALFVVSISVVLSVAAFIFFYRHGVTNVYGDGVAHLNIARKVIDSPDSSLWRRYIQIGTPWLPLQTLLTVPLVRNEHLWRTGIAGSIISMLSFIAATLAVFKIATRLYREEAGVSGRAMALISASVFALNPAALYMQSTPMTESLFMASLAITVLFLHQWSDKAGVVKLMMAGAAAGAATLSRYEAWPVALAAAAIVALVSAGSAWNRLRNTGVFLSVAAIGPCYWLWHNWAIYDDALAFIRGPHSARGIYLENAANLGWSRVFVGHWLPSLALMLLTAATCVGLLILLLALAGAIRTVAVKRRRIREFAFLSLLIIPFLFHVFSIYRGEIQVFPISAFGLLNVRYGLPHLLAAAVFAPATIPLMKTFGRAAGIALCTALIVLQYSLIWSDGPLQIAVCQEGYRNGVNSRPAREHRAAAEYLRSHPPAAHVLLYSGSLGPVVSGGGLVFSKIIHEGAERWHQIDATAPNDVSTIVLERGDPLDNRINSNPSLFGDISRRFRTAFSVGNLVVLEKTSKDSQTGR